MRSRAASCFVAVIAVGCQGQRPTSTVSALGGAVASVGTVRVPASLVAEVTRASGEPPSRALDDLVADALAARGAQDARLDRDPSVAWSVTTAIARRYARQGLMEASAAGAPRPDELEAVHVSHAVVLRSGRVPGATAVAIADAIRRNVEGVRSADEFESRAKATPHADARVVVERLEPFSADGHFDSSFIAAAFELRSAGDISPVVETQFGWHVVYLVGRDPLRDEGGRASELAAAVTELRARDWLESRLRLRARTSHVEILAGADALMSQVKVP